jgi:hypothetical protein
MTWFLTDEKEQWQQDPKDFVDYKDFKANRVFKVHKEYKEFKVNRDPKETVESKVHKVTQVLQDHKVRKGFKVWHPLFQDLRDLQEQVHPSHLMVEVQRLHSSTDLHLTVEVLYKFLFN